MQRFYIESINTKVTAGVIGKSKLTFDIWGDAVNVASRMCSTGLVGKVQVNQESFLRLQDFFNFEYRGMVFVKGKGDMKTYLLGSKTPQSFET